MHITTAILLSLPLLTSGCATTSTTALKAKAPVATTGVTPTVWGIIVQVQQKHLTKTDPSWFRLTLVTKSWENGVRDYRDFTHGYMAPAGDGKFDGIVAVHAQNVRLEVRPGGTRLSCDDGVVSISPFGFNLGVVSVNGWESTPNFKVKGEKFGEDCHYYLRPSDFPQSPTTAPATRR